MPAVLGRFGQLSLVITATELFTVITDFQTVPQAKPLAPTRHVSPHHLIILDHVAYN
jgi:hypothetical protein